MTATHATSSGLRPAIQNVPAPAPKLRTAALGASPQTAAVSFAKSSTAGFDAIARISDANLADATTNLTLSLDLKAGKKYSFSFYYPSGGPKVTLTNSSG